MKKWKILFTKLVLGNGNIYLVWLTNKYTVSINDVVEKIDEGFDALVTISMWNSYTSEAKKYALENQFGLFTFREFMGALNFLDPSQYYTGVDKKMVRGFTGNVVISLIDDIELKEY